MKRLMTVACIVMLSTFTQVSLVSQTLPSVAAYRIGSAEAGDYVAQTVNDLIFSFVMELRGYRVNDLRQEAPPADLSVPAGMDYIFHGSLSPQPNGVRLELILRGGPEDITRKISRVYENTNRVLLESRMLVRDLFDQTVALPEPQLAEKKPDSTHVITTLSLDGLSGTWSGEPGVEKIMIVRGGRGVMVLSSGVSISLTLEVQDNILLVRQRGTLNPRQFLDLPDDVARQAAAIAAPPEWSLRLENDRDLLVGSKKTVEIIHDGKKIVTMNTVESEVEWKR